MIKESVDTALGGADTGGVLDAEGSEEDEPREGRGCMRLFQPGTSASGYLFTGGLNGGVKPPLDSGVETGDVKRDGFRKRGGCRLESNTPFAPPFICTFSKGGENGGVKPPLDPGVETGDVKRDGFRERGGRRLGSCMLLVLPFK